jgi:hypothetical protein
MSNVNVRLKKYNFIMRKIEVVLAEEAYGFTPKMVMDKK